jgi:hypothetical protein
VFFLGLATHALILGDASVFLIFVAVAALAAAWDMGWRVRVWDWADAPSSGHAATRL